ncbi:MAG: hypothetical protein AAFO87_07695 [Cyanobacteria bacterium J06607_6]
MRSPPASTTTPRLPRAGGGIDSLCSEVGLEDPSTIAHHTPAEAEALSSMPEAIA